MAAVASI